jgi:hypothetical protein
MTSDGSIDWKWRTGADVIGMPAFGEHHVYFVALDNVLRALDHKSGAQLWKAPLTFRPIAGPIEAADTLIVAGLVPPMRAYLATDGKPGGELTAAGELAAPPHLFLPDKAPLPIVIAVTRDIVKGATVTALTRNVEPAITPIVPLPNLIPMNPDAAVKKP